MHLVGQWRGQGKDERGRSIRQMDLISSGQCCWWESVRWVHLSLLITTFLHSPDPYLSQVARNSP